MDVSLVCQLILVIVANWVVFVVIMSSKLYLNIDAFLFSLLRRFWKKAEKQEVKKTEEMTSKLVKTIDQSILCGMFAWFCF